MTFVHPKYDIDLLEKLALYCKSKEVVKGDIRLWKHLNDQERLAKSLETLAVLTDRERSIRNTLNPYEIEHFRKFNQYV